MREYYERKLKKFFDFIELQLLNEPLNFGIINL